MRFTRRRGPTAADSARELLYGDVPLSNWASNGTSAVSALFRRAQSCLADQDRVGARQALLAVLDMRNLASRDYLQAWDALRGLGEMPPAEWVKHLYGVVLDLPVPRGRDTLAVYEDDTCRYLNFSGKVLVWEVPESTVIRPLVDQFLNIGRSILQVIGPWQGPRPPLPAGLARLSLLSPSGLHFGQGEFEALAQDAVTGRAIAAGTRLLQELVRIATQDS